MINHKKLLALSLIASIMVLSAMLWANISLYQHNKAILSAELRQQMLQVAITQASNIDAKMLDALQEEEDYKKPEWKHIVSQLAKTKADNPGIVFLYIFRRSSEYGLEFVADAASINPYANSDNDHTNDVDANGDGIIEPDNADKLQFPGQYYPIPNQEAWQSTMGEAVYTNLYSDQWGSMVSGFAPIMVDGEVKAVVGADMSAENFITKEQQILRPFLYFGIFSSSIIGLLAFALICMWRNRANHLAKLDKQKSDLIDLVSHQINEPITKSIWMLGELKNTRNKKKVDDIITIQSSALSIASELMDVSRVDMECLKANVQKIDIVIFMREFFASYQKEIAQGMIIVGMIILEHPDNANVMCDQRLLKIALGNVIENAIKYTKNTKQPQIDIKLFCRNKQFCIEVSDNGIGIQDYEVKKVFNKFYRSKNAKDMPGNGLGLYVTKAAMEVQGGGVMLRPNIKGGLTVTISIPLWN